MKKIVLALILVLIGSLLFSTNPSAQHGHGHGATSMKMETKEVLVEGVRVTFQIMTNEEHRKMLREMKMREDIEPGTTHNIAVILKDEKSQKEIKNAQISMKVVDPKGKDQIKTLRYEDMMRSYEAYFNLSEKGKYQVMILFKIGEKKGTAGIYYDVK